MPCIFISSLFFLLHTFVGAAGNLPLGIRRTLSCLSVSVSLSVPGIVDRVLLDCKLVFLFVVVVVVASYLVSLAEK